jgi:hypothetical protein
MADMPGAQSFTRPPDILERGVSRVRASSTPSWWGALPEGEHFNQSVHCDWNGIDTRAFGPLDGMWAAGAAAGPAADIGTRVVNDALVMVDRAYRIVHAVTVASHSRFEDCVERWAHTLGAMRTMTVDGESANHSANVGDLSRHYGPVETMIHLLKCLVMDMCRIAGLSVAAHWPLAIAHAADIANVMPRVSLHGRSARATLDGSPPNLLHFCIFGCVAVILAVGAYKNKGLLAPPGVTCVYVGVGLRRIVSQHYRLDETKFPGIPSRRPPGVVAHAGVVPENDPFDAAFVPLSAFVAFGATPCTLSVGAGWPLHAPPPLLSPYIWRSPPAYRRA